MTIAIAPRSRSEKCSAAKGDHVWLGAFLRVLSDWRRQGVFLDVYKFTGHPTIPEHLDTGRRISLEAIGRLSRGPLILFSRALSRRDRMGLASWVRALSFWPVCAWVDPEPGPGLMSAQDAGALARQGVVRFSGDGAGLSALVRYLARGEVPAKLPDVELPSTADAEVRAALRLWRIAVALIPEPGWDLVERIRRSHPLISRVLPAREHVRLLLDEIDRWMRIANGPRGQGACSRSPARRIGGGARSSSRRSSRSWSGRLGFMTRS
jgi:hypothetical protein